MGQGEGVSSMKQKHDALRPLFELSRYDPYSFKKKLLKGVRLTWEIMDEISFGANYLFFSNGFYIVLFDPRC